MRDGAADSTAAIGQQELGRLLPHPQLKLLSANLRGSQLYPSCTWFSESEQLMIENSRQNVNIMHAVSELLLSANSHNLFQRCFTLAND